MGARGHFCRSCFCDYSIFKAVPSAVSRRRVIGGLVALAAAAVPSRVFAQKLWAQGLQDSCSFFPNQRNDTDIYTFGSTKEAIAVIARITRAVGLQPNFQIEQANVGNAAATILGGTRYILYSEVFIQQILRKAATEWAAWTILAHEVGHHLNGHTLTGGGSRPPIELEADRFAGFVIRRMNGTLEQALILYRQLPAAGSDTHPPRSARLEAVTAGWVDANRGQASAEERRSKTRTSTACDWLIGDWKWDDTFDTEESYRADGTVKNFHDQLTGRWTCRDNEVVIHWPDGRVERQTVSSDRTKMYYVNAFGIRSEALRK